MCGTKNAIPKGPVIDCVGYCGDGESNHHAPYCLSFGLWKISENLPGYPVSEVVVVEELKNGSRWPLEVEGEGGIEGPQRKEEFLCCLLTEDQIK